MTQFFLLIKAEASVPALQGSWLIYNITASFRFPSICVQIDLEIELMKPEDRDQIVILIASENGSVQIF